MSDGGRLRRFEAGESVVLREIWRSRIWSARPATAVRDEPALQMFFVAAGGTWLAPHAPEGTPLRAKREPWILAERRCDTHALSFAFPGEAHAVLLFFEDDWTPRGWYVNLQEPLRRTRVGFDYLDEALDIVVPLDRSSFAWKDEDELQEEVELGAFTPEESRAFRAEGERAVRRLLERRDPFDRDWTAWRPDPGWPVAALPDGWDTEPVAEG